VYVDASAIVTQARTALLAYTGWHAVERTVRAMENAARDGDTERLRVLVAELEAVVARAPTAQDNGRVAMPGNVADLVIAVLNRLRWRIKEMSTR
jgi:hypothetical protein